MPTTPSIAERMTDVGSPVVVGIDPGATTGFAILDTSRRRDSLPSRLTVVTSASFFDAAAMLRDVNTLPGVALCVVEDSRSGPIYAKRDHVRGRARDRVARNVGGIDRDVTLWLALCERLSIPCYAAEPIRAKKWSAADIEQQAGWTERANQHGRDAARLALTFEHLARSSFVSEPA